MRIEPLNHLNHPIHPTQDIKAVADSGSTAAQVEKVKRNILENARRNMNPEIAHDHENSPQKIHHSPDQRAMQLLDRI
jgi:hypothetical protein